MAKVLSAVGLEFLNSIADKYRFRNHYEIERDEALDFCRRFLEAVHLGLNADPEDIDDIVEIRDTLAGG